MVCNALPVKLSSPLIMASLASLLMKLSFLIMPGLLTTFPAVNLKTKLPDSPLFLHQRQHHFGTIFRCENFISLHLFVYKVNV